MAELLMTLGLEVIALIMLIFTVSKRKKFELLLLILSLITVFSHAVFWYMAVTYWTYFFWFELVLYVTVGVCVILYMMNEQRDSKKLKTIYDWSVVVTIFISVVLLLGSIFACFIEQFKWLDKPTVEVVTEEIAVPENLQELDAKFVCIHNAKEKVYDLYWVWSNGIYKVTSYTEDECTVYQMPDSRQDLPKLETKKERFYMYNYAFEHYQKPTLIGSKTEKTYSLYVCESSYKEVYTK